MAKLEVVNYSAEWNPVHNSGFIRAVFSNGQQAELPIDSTEEFIAVMMMLEKAPVFLDTRTMDLAIAQRSTGK
ncbi:MAG: hypothetical protein SH809_01645 [Rhodothermales bacterium]|nr:hypothetical protein [Rhodothermales bacterium]